MEANSITRDNVGMYANSASGPGPALVGANTAHSGPKASAIPIQARHAFRLQLSAGQPWKTPAGVPAHPGVLKYPAQSPYDTHIGLDQPKAGVAALGAFNCDSPSRVALLKHRPGPPPFDLLDFGCGPGRDLCTFKAMGHRVVGLEGAPSAAAMVRAHSGRSSECACRLMPRHSPARLGSAKRCLGSAGLRRRRLKLSAARVLQQEGVDVRQLPLLLRLGATLSVAAFVFQIQQDGLA